MELKYEQYQFSPILGWSISRYETFDKCKRQYFYSYYSKYVPDIPGYKISKLKELTSVPLETGNVVHDVLEAFLRRLQKSDTDIDEKRFFEYSRKLAQRYFSEKTFIEQYYDNKTVEIEAAYEKIETCLRNFIQSPCYNWIFMAAIRERKNWMIEPPGFGETRLNGMKAYCKMDFLLPVDGDIHILDWKTGHRDEVKHKSQLMGYAAATNSNFGIEWNRICPKIVYLYPEFGELEIQFDSDQLQQFFNTIKDQTESMYSFCSNVEENRPLPIEKFEKNPSPSLCRQCRFQELCFPQRENRMEHGNMDFDYGSARQELIF
ncbi:MAG: PD-(D/E)XK nuclease family protein [Fibrobacter sp.]|nr:PD-(D/E)XK nuclease family protein [Fibrobacter sp.]